MTVYVRSELEGRTAGGHLTRGAPFSPVSTARVDRDDEKPTEKIPISLSPSLRVETQGNYILSRGTYIQPLCQGLSRQEGQTERETLETPRHRTGQGQKNKFPLVEHRCIIATLEQELQVLPLLLNNKERSHKTSLKLEYTQLQGPNMPDSENLSELSDYSDDSPPSASASSTGHAATATATTAVGTAQKRVSPVTYDEVAPFLLLPML